MVYWLDNTLRNYPQIRSWPATNAVWLKCRNGRKSCKLEWFHCQTGIIPYRRRGLHCQSKAHSARTYNAMLTGWHCQLHELTRWNHVPIFLFNISLLLWTSVTKTWVLFLSTPFLFMSFAPKLETHITHIPNQSRIFFKPSSGKCNTTPKTIVLCLFVQKTL